MFVSKKLTKFDYTENEIIKNINLFIKDKQLENSETENKNKIFIHNTQDTLHNTQVKDKFNDLVLHNKGYLYDLYDAHCHNLNWLTGWEISKKIYEKIINNNEDEQQTLTFTTHGYFGNIDDDLLLGFLYCISSLSKNSELKYNYYIYDNNNIQNIIDKNGKIINEEYKLESNNIQYIEEEKQQNLRTTSLSKNNDQPNNVQSEMSPQINYINSIDLDELEYNSSSICRYVNNNLQKNAIYLDFSIVNTNNLPKYDIKNILHSIMKLNDNECMLVFSLSEYINFDTTLYIYFLNCIFEEIELIKYPWDNMIWAFCYKRKFLINKKIFTELMENFNLVAKEELNDNLTLSKLSIIQDELEEFKDNILHNDLTVEKWMSTNEEILERINT